MPVSVIAARAARRRPAILLLALGLGGPALAQEGTLQGCRRIADPSARLACYDGLALPAATSPAQAPPSPPAPPPAAPAQPTRSKDDFGLPDKAKAQPVEAIESTVAAGFSGWSPNERITLGNGQVWQIIDGSNVAVAPGARKVTVRRGSFGSFYLDFEGLNTSPRVRRVQ